MSLFPALREDAVVVGVARQRIDDLVTIDAKIGGYLFVAGGDIWIGGSTVTTSGATEGFKVISGDKVRAAVDGPGAEEIYFIANGNKPMRVEQYG